MKTRIGCLTALALFAALISYQVWSGANQSDQVGCLTWLGLGALAVIYMGSFIERMTMRRKAGQGNAPADPLKRDADEKPD